MSHRVAEQRPTGSAISLSRLDETSGRAWLRAGRSTRFPPIEVQFDRAQVVLQATFQRRCWLQGIWQSHIATTFVQFAPAPSWSCVCWVSDEDGDYLELQMTGPQGMRVERQLYLCRRDRWLLLADVIRGVRPVPNVSDHRLRLISVLPCVSGWELTEQTTVLRESNLKFRAVMLGLGLPDFPEKQMFEIRADGWWRLIETPGRGLWSPWFFDLDPSRAELPLEWKRLTITENRKVVRSDRAAAYRLRIGSQQWLLYRSLQPPRTGRAVLGMHTRYETVLARFTPAGDVEYLIAVE